MKLACLSATVASTLGLAALTAHARDNGQWTESPASVRKWFQSLMQPDNPYISCCGDAIRCSRPMQPSDRATACSLGRPRYRDRVAVLLHAFFRPNRAMTPLRFANPSPPAQAGLRTSTSKLSFMLGTQRKSPANDGRAYDQRRILPSMVPE
jgi:hypothetical protein